MIELKINEPENVIGGSEPPKYLTPEGEARAKKQSETLKMLMKTKMFSEAIPGSGLMIPNKNMEEAILYYSLHQAR